MIIKFHEEMNGIKIERIEWDTSYHMPEKHFHNEYEIYYLLSGQRYYFIDQSTYFIKRGSIVFIKKGLIHRTGFAGSKTHDRILLTLEESVLNPLLSLYDGKVLSELFDQLHSVVELDAVAQRFVEGLLLSIPAEVRDQQTSYQFMTYLKIANLLIYVLRFQDSQQKVSDLVTPVKSMKHNKVDEVANYIIKNCTSLQSIEEIATQFYISKCYLCHIFKEVTGFTITEYINHNRIKKSCELLITTKLSISQISETVGFESVTYFCRIFKQYNNTTPLKFRNNCNVTV